jgi:CO dehydrogenase maturation factor
VKLAIAGKGGVGKSTLAAGLSLLAAREGHRVLAVDADPDANLASALGIPDDRRRAIVPIARQKALIEERTGATVGQYGQIFKLNPDVADIADTYAHAHEGVALLVLGAIESGGSGCACPESVLIRALVTDLALQKNQVLIMDFEAGLEHLGRATARGVDTMVVVVEPGRRACDCARQVRRMAREIGLSNVCAVANKVVDAEDRRFIREALPDLDILGWIPFSDRLRTADREGRSVLDGVDDDLVTCFRDILDRLIERSGVGVGRGEALRPQ